MNKMELLPQRRYSVTYTNCSLCNRSGQIGGGHCGDRRLGTLKAQSQVACPPEKFLLVSFKTISGVSPDIRSARLVLTFTDRKSCRPLQGFGSTADGSTGMSCDCEPQEVKITYCNMFQQVARFNLGSIYRPPSGSLSPKLQIKHTSNYR